MILRRVIAIAALSTLAACGGGSGGGSLPPAGGVPTSTPTASPSPVPAANNIRSSPVNPATPVDPKLAPIRMTADMTAAAGALVNARLGAVHEIPLQTGTPTLASTRRAPRGVGYPADLSYFGGFVMGSAQIHPVYLDTNSQQCSQSCWGTPNQIITDLGASNFMHIVDPYVGSSASNRYTLGNGTIYGINAFPSGPGNPVVGQGTILGLLYNASLAFGTGYNHMYQFFLPPNTDTCFDLSARCYSPDNTSTFHFCGYHSSVDYGNGVIVYAVLPYADVRGCRTTGGPNSVNGDDLVDSTAWILSHEVFEAITDPDPFSGWNNTYFGNEIGDLCAGFYSDLPLNGTYYRIQLEYSNAYHACTNTP